jgi:tetratricopeptide (TPR) repeat protein
MKPVLRFALTLLALIALASAGPGAQSAATQKPPDPRPAAPAEAAATQKPAETPQELPDEAKAFNTAMAEKNPLKRVELLEKFIADNPKATSTLLSTAKSQVSSSLLAALKDARAKYQTVIDTELEDAKKTADTRPMYSTYNNIASRLANAGVYSEEAEDLARKGLAGMDERTYFENRKKQYDRSLATYEKILAAYEKQTTAAKGGKPAAAPAGQPESGTIAVTAGGAAAVSSGGTGPAAPAAPAAPAGARGGTPGATAGPNYRFATKDGVMQASLAPPRPAPSTPATPPAPRAPTKPTMPTDEEMRTALKSERASAQATLGQILMKRGKADEGQMVLREAYAAKPAASTRATIARALYDSAKKAGNDNDQLEYLTVLVLAGRPTADELKDLDAVYRKTHNGSADGMESMLDARWRRDNVRFAVTPYSRPANVKPTGRTVLAEVFPGAG